jgi:hypothetical protein
MPFTSITPEAIFPCSVRDAELLPEEEGESQVTKIREELTWDEHTEETMSARDNTDSDAVLPTLPLDRFIGEVDAYFICAMCRGVADDPRECKCCENLICEGCLDQSCPYGCEVLETKDPALYTRIVYSRLQVRCQFCSNGCDFFESVAVVKAHEQACIMRIEACNNPLCDNLYRLYDRPEGGRQTCSAMCSNVYEFSQTLRKADHLTILSHFCTALQAAKDQLREEMRAEIAREHELLDQERLVHDEYEAERAQMSKDLHLRMISQHPGKWSGKCWSCCRSTDKYVVGCRELN